MLANTWGKCQIARFTHQSFDRRLFNMSRDDYAGVVCSPYYSSGNTQSESATNDEDLAHDKLRHKQYVFMLQVLFHILTWLQSQSMSHIWLQSWSELGQCWKCYARIVNFYTSFSCTQLNAVLVLVSCRRVFSCPKKLQDSSLRSSWCMSEFGCYLLRVGGCGLHFVCIAQGGILSVSSRTGNLFGSNYFVIPFQSSTLCHIIHSAVFPECVVSGKLCHMVPICFFSCDWRSTIHEVALWADAYCSYVSPYPLTFLCEIYETSQSRSLE